MKLATRPGVHVDRAACAWLIRRFIDPDAEFVFPADPAAIPAGATARRPRQDQAGHPVWAGDRHLLGDVPAAGGPHQHCGRDAHRIHERLDIGGEVGKGVSRRGLISAAVTALVHRHGIDSARQQRQQPVEGTPRLTPRVQQHNRRRGGRTGRDIGNGHPGCQANVADARLLVHSSTLARTGSGLQTSRSSYPCRRHAGPAPPTRHSCGWTRFEGQTA